MTFFIAILRIPLIFLGAVLMATSMMAIPDKALTWFALGLSALGIYIVFFKKKNG